MKTYDIKLLHDQYGRIDAQMEADTMANLLIKLHDHITTLEKPLQNFRMITISVNNVLDKA